MKSIRPVLVCAAWPLLAAIGSAQVPQAEVPTSPSVCNTGAGLFDYEKVQLTEALLNNGTGNGPTNVTKLFWYSDPSSPSQNPQERPRCKAYPGTPEWPAEAVWSTFSTTLHGALIKAIPQAAPCFNSWPSVRDNATCDSIRKNWNGFRYQVDDPTSALFPLYEGRTCLIGNAPNGTCTLGGYPVYVVNVTTVAEVQLAVNFARNANLRLVVKNKGHDYNAKSTGGGGLSVYTNYLREIRHIPSYSCGKYSGPAFKIGVGVEVGTLYQYADALNLSVVGGLGRTIGLAGGYSQGGGHSPLSSVYGLGADQLLSLQVVLPNGSFVTANQDEYPDLYWAMRGGGGSTFGVVTSAVVAAHPRIPVASVAYSFTNKSPNTTETFWAGVREFFQTFISNADAGHYVVFRLSCNPPDEPWTCTLQPIPHWANNMTIVQLQAHLAPYFARLADLGITVVNPVWGEYPSLLAAFDKAFSEGNSQSAGSASGSTHVGSRIFPRRNWEDPALFNATLAAIRYTSEKTSARMQGFNIKAAKHPLLNQDNAAHPAWRDTLLFAITGNAWGSETSSAETIAARSKQLVEWLQPWRDATPDGGSYLNEGDINEPNFQKAFYGDNYARLYDLKQKYDPTGTFFALTAVGSEDWETTDQIPYYPTTNGRLCRKS